jgi:hypothetical protein
LLREAAARQLLAQGVIVTAHPNPREADGFPVVYKPLDFDDFLQRIRMYLDRRAEPATLSPLRPARSTVT